MQSIVEEEKITNYALARKNIFYPDMEFVFFYGYPTGKKPWEGVFSEKVLTHRDPKALVDLKNKPVHRNLLRDFFVVEVKTNVKKTVKVTKFRKKNPN